jgi:peptidoglycan hydrolase CwlO-like protein
MYRELAIAVLLSVVLWGSLFSSTASSQLIESRLNNLEADLNRLESRLANIEAQTNRTLPSQVPTAPTLPQGTRARRTTTQSQREQMFDRLATLVVELKQQVNKLEQRVGKLEAR